jgi:glucose-6-phosphate 1-epimerase
MNINQLNANFGILGQIDFVNGHGNLPFIKVYNQTATALISLLGGQILSYKRINDADDMLFLSQKSLYEDGKAIRGGIPVCWPWFGPDPKGLHRPNHGFVRNHFWSVASVTSTTTETTINLLFSQAHKAESTWKQPFSLVLEFTIGETLGLKLTTHNLDNKPFAITQAFHTYFNVGDISKVRVLGLEGCTYYDKLDQGKKKTQQGIVTIIEAVDRIYEDVDNHVALIDTSLYRRVEIDSENCKTGVVWNPWTKTMPDLMPDDYQRFVCVETGNIAFDLIQIPPGGEHTLSTSFKILHIQNF